jgi:hypothetical protein
MDSALIARRNVRGYKPGRGDGFLSVTRNPQHAFFWRESKTGFTMKFRIVFWDMTHP